MKAQRYRTTACDDEFIEDSAGEWMLSDDGDKLEAEVKVLKAEKVHTVEDGELEDTLRNFLGDSNIKSPVGRIIGEVEALRQKVADAEWWIEHRSEFIAPPGLQWWDALSRTVASLRRSAAREASDE